MGLSYTTSGGYPQNNPGEEPIYHGPTIPDLEKRLKASEALTIAYETSDSSLIRYQARL